MEILHQFIDFFIHIDKHLGDIIVQCGFWTYLILFLIVFCETGLVVMPLLPGDSLLFAAGAFAAAGSFQVGALVVVLIVAAIAGDAVNYTIGHFIGPKVFERKNSRFLKHEHLVKTHQFYEKYGGKTIILARFIPIIRTFAPFVAGVGEMTYLKFATFNVIGGIAWVTSFTFGGYFFGNLPKVKEHFSLVILAIIIISIMPIVFEYLKRFRSSAQKV